MNVKFNQKEKLTAGRGSLVRFLLSPLLRRRSLDDSRAGRIFSAADT